MKGQSDSKPPNFLKSAGKTQVLYNIISKDVTDMDSNPKTVWEYDYVGVEGKVTRAKVLEAMQKDNEVVESVTADELSAQLVNTDNELKLSALTGLTYEQLDTYIDANVTTLAGVRAYLKKLSRMVMAQMQRRT